jgi:uncharacterized protein
MSAGSAPPRLGASGSPFHAGEQAVQARVGVRERVEQMGRRMLRDFMPDEHRQFFQDLPFLVVGSTDAEGAPWASLLLGTPGFVSTPSARRLVVQAEPLPGDPLGAALLLGAPLGVLGLELPTRRRNRVNGRIVALSGGRFELAVDQSFGNCKQYIQSRAGSFKAPGSIEPPRAETALLSDDAARVLERTDTTFIASRSSAPALGGAEGVDVSHRGGRPGFVRVSREAHVTRLLMPDFRGNFMFNTLGNLEVHPYAGLLALDFESGSVLAITTHARMIESGPEVSAFEGAERLLELEVVRGWLWHAVSEAWTAPEFSPQLEGTGTWAEDARD